VARALRQEGYEVAERPYRRLPAVAGRLAERLDALVQARGAYVQELHVLGELDKTIACDVSLAERELGYDPRVELLEGMRRSIRWCRQQGIAL
jgi:nucleoside-diphosphate-sugar epimerase